MLLFLWIVIIAWIVIVLHANLAIGKALTTIFFLTFSPNPYPAKSRLYGHLHVMLITVYGYEQCRRSCAHNIC